ncbi:hypothetical protein J0H58_27395 [bacterium]|nr:hypothetical protein [bacterium]
MYTVDDGARLPPFRPHYDQKARRSDLAAVRFAAPDRLLTVTTTGGFAVWRTVDRSQAVNVPGRLPPDSIKPNHAMLARAGFDLSQDGKQLALFDGGGITLYDPQTGKAGVTTDRVRSGGKLTAGAAAFRADGTRLAAGFRIGDESASEDLVVVWDTTTGKQLSQFRPQVNDKFGWTVQWFGPDHLLVRTTGWQSRVWSVENPRQVASMATFVFHGSPGDEMWAHQDRSNLPGREPPDAPKFLIHALPPLLGSNPTLWFTYRGFTAAVPLD